LEIAGAVGPVVDAEGLSGAGFAAGQAAEALDWPAAEGIEAAGAAPPAHSGGGLAMEVLAGRIGTELGGGDGCGGAHRRTSAPIHSLRGSAASKCPQKKTILAPVNKYLQLFNQQNKNPCYM